MEWFKDVHDRQVRLTEERREHIESDHPEMAGQIYRVSESLEFPDITIQSRTDPDSELFYRHYKTTPVSEKYLCVVVKTDGQDSFIVTAYFTDTIKRGETLWERK